MGWHQEMVDFWGRQHTEREPTKGSRACEHCGHDFSFKRITATFCSTACRVAAKRKRDRDAAELAEVRAEAHLWEPARPEWQWRD